jgi:hypothetical protein
MAYFIGPQLNEEYKDYLRRVLTDGGFYSRPNPKDFQNDVDNILPLNPILYTPANAGKVSKMYSLIPNDGTGDFTVSRNGTATYFDKDGLLKTAAANVPRFEFDPLTGDFKGVLVEPSATNSLQRSEEFTDSYWGKPGFRLLVTSNQAIAPDGNMTADLLTSNDTTDTTFQRNIGLPSEDTIFTYSIFVKKANSDFFAISKVFNSSNFNARFDINQGLILDQGTESTVEIIELPNGWFRVSLSHLVRTTDLNNIIKFQVCNQNNNAVSTIGNSVFAWGAQENIGSTLTSYIPTVASTVTRPADVIDVTVPVGVTEIKETVNGVENTITSIPTTYQLPNGQVSRVIMT